MVALRRKLRSASKHHYPVWPNLLKRGRPNSVWVSDITYIWTFEGWLYLAVVLDLFSRGIVGFAGDTNENGKRKIGYGQKVHHAGIYWIPGTTNAKEKTYKINEMGIWKEDGK